MEKIVSIVGVTASGKTGLSIKLAKEFNGEIISADSRQVYRGLDIGSAKVTKEEMEGVPHYLLDVADAGEHFDVFEFQKLAYEKIDEILRRGKLPIIVGGTGLYSRSVVEGYNFSKGKNVQRYDVLQICLMPSKEIVNPIIEKRVEDRLKQGMIEETQKLLDAGVSREWLSKLGLEYFWNVEYIDGRIDLDTYKKMLTLRIIQFAKRQRTWFRREKNTTFLYDPSTYYSESKKLISLFLT